MRILLAAGGSKYTGRAVDYLIKHRERFGPPPQRVIVMGSHGHGVLSSLVMGSCANKVLAQCKVPVLLIR